MVVEMLLLILIALAVFAYVLAPIFLPRRESETVNDPLPTSAPDEASEPTSADQQPVHERS